MTTTNLYETDIYAWTQQQAALLRAEDFAEVDWNNIIEEIESLGISQRSELASRLTVLMAHLLKWQYQSSKRSHSWRVTIVNQRIEIERHLSDNPTLASQLATFVANNYRGAVKKATVETRLERNTFPVECPWTAAQIVDEEFWP